MLRALSSTIRILANSLPSPACGCSRPCRTETPNDPIALALAALAATLGDERRAQRFLDLTGIGTDELRRTAGDPALLAALMRFLEAHEPDLVAVAERLASSRQTSYEARRRARGRDHDEDDPDHRRDRRLRRGGGAEVRGRRLAGDRDRPPRRAPASASGGAWRRLPSARDRHARPRGASKASPGSSPPWGEIDLLLNNAGLAPPTDPLPDTDWDADRERDRHQRHRPRRADPRAAAQAGRAQGRRSSTCRRSPRPIPTRAARFTPGPRRSSANSRSTCAATSPAPACA